MALSDCMQCWDTPCTCGWDYRNYSIKHLQEKIDMFQKIIDFKKAHPRKRYSKNWNDPETKADRELMEHIHGNKEEGK